MSGSKESSRWAPGYCGRRKTARPLSSRYGSIPACPCGSSAAKKRLALCSRVCWGHYREQTSSRIIADVGGWSTELVWVEGQEARKMQSVPIGTVALTERFLRKDPPPQKDLESLAAWTKGVLGEIRKTFEKEGLRVEGLHSHLVGTAGTMTTLAAIDQGLTVYDPEKITGHRISRSTLEKIYFHLRSIPVEERREVPGLEKGREDLIIAGAVVALNLLEVFGLKTLMVVDSGLLEGILLDGLERMDRGSTERSAWRA